MEMNVRLAAERAHVLFVAENWKWHGIGVPTVDQIEEGYLGLAEAAEGFGSASSGRLTVTESELGLEFAVSTGTIDLSGDAIYDDREDANTHILVGGQVIHNVHPEEVCAAEDCAVHNPSDHHMRSWPQYFRTDRGITERICEHGIGHPDPDHMTWYASCHNPQDTRTEGIHGCDGCCQPPIERVLRPAQLSDED